MTIDVASLICCIDTHPRRQQAPKGAPVMAKKRGPRMSIAQLEEALSNTKQEIQGLKEKREKLLAQVAEVDKQIAIAATEDKRVEKVARGLFAVKKKGTE